MYIPCDKGSMVGYDNQSGYIYIRVHSEVYGEEMFLSAPAKVDDIVAYLNGGDIDVCLSVLSDDQRCLIQNGFNCKEWDRINGADPNEVVL